MSAASPLLASANKRAIAALVDAGPLLMIAIFAAALTDRLAGAPYANAAIVAFVYVAYHAAFNHYFHGETIGRHMVHVRLVSSHGDVLSATKSILRPIVRVAWIALFVWVAVQVREPWVAAGAPITELLLVAVVPWRQSCADLLCGTLVINAPVVQPHRAPAGPMYSATDAEFGNRPQHHK